MTIIDTLNETFENLLPMLNGVYVGRIKNEMESMFHLAYWLYTDKKMNETEIIDTVFNLAPFKIGETTKPDLIFLINKAKELC